MSSIFIWLTNKASNVERVAWRCAVASGWDLTFDSAVGRPGMACSTMEMPNSPRVLGPSSLSLLLTPMLFFLELHGYFLFQAGLSAVANDQSLCGREFV